MENKKEKGFTLIEMLVVIVVIGILATIVLVSVSSGRKKAQATKAKTDMAELSKAFEMAASEGCKKIGFTSGDSGKTCTFKCVDGTNSNQYATVGAAPNGIKYTITIGASAASSDSTSGGSGTWSSNIGSELINKDYNFQATGFDSGAVTFTCSNSSTTRSGCYCSTDGGCVSIQ